MKLTEKLIELEEKMTEMLEEVKTLKMYAYSLEDENEKLRRELCQYPEEPKGCGRKRRKIQGRVMKT